jgi:HEAT repeat protein
VATLVIKIVGQFDLETRQAAASQILASGSPEGVQALGEIFINQNNKLAKTAVCNAIAAAKSQEPAFKQPLLALLDGDDPDLSKAALAALGAYEDPVIRFRVFRATRELERQLFVEAIRADMKQLYQLTPETDRLRLLQGWLANSLSIRRLTALALIHESLTEGNEPAKGEIEEVRKVLDDGQEVVREQAVAVLRDFRQSEDARLLEARLPQEPSPKVRALIYHTLGHLRDAKSIPVCVEGLQDRTPAVAAAAASALGELARVSEGASNGPELEPVVTALLARAEAGMIEPELRQRVLEAMGIIADPRFGDVLAKHAGATEPIPAVRQAAIRGLGRIGDAAHINVVKERLAAEANDAGIRAAAVTAIGQLGSTRADLNLVVARLDPLVEPSPAVQRQAWAATESLYVALPRAEQLAFVSEHPDTAVRLAAEAQFQPAALAALGELLLTYVIDAGKTNPQAALAFLDKLAQTVPADRLGGGWADRVAKTREPLATSTRPAASTKTAD